jgi:hypothetical protein
LSCRRRNDAGADEGATLQEDHALPAFAERRAYAPTQCWQCTAGDEVSLGVIVIAIFLAAVTIAGVLIVLREWL